MNANNRHSLEGFVERHRADFDTHEPRPDLWAALEQQLAAPVGPAMRLSAAAPAPAPTPPARSGWLRHYGVAAALALLVVAAGTSEAWKSKEKAAQVADAAPTAATYAAHEADAAVYQGGNPLSMTAADRTSGADSQLVRAVRGMETYYTSQLARRQHELRGLQGPGLAGMTADWQHELVSLDSSYRQLKQELLHHPQPDAVLTAMNRNLQNRLDILDQQLHLGAPADAAPAPNGYVLADSRRLPE